MKKETRAYLLDVDNLLHIEKVIDIKEFNDEQFIDCAEQYGYIFTLPKLQETINNGDYVMSDFYIRFIEVELHELVEFDNDLYERAE